MGLGVIIDFSILVMQWENKIKNKKLNPLGRGGKGGYCVWLEVQICLHQANNICKEYPHCCSSVSPHCIALGFESSQESIV